MVNTFVMVLGKILPLYGLIFLGLLVGRKQPRLRDWVSRALIYCITPVVLFYGAYTVELSIEHIALPILLFILASTACLLAYYTAGHIWQTSERNILSYTAGTGNTGYFGVPLVLMILGKPYVGLVVLGNIGMILYEVTVGMFVSAKAHASVFGSIKRLLKLPIIYAFSLGIFCNVTEVQLSPDLLHVFEGFLGGYTLLGMMLIGFGIAVANRSHVDWLFVGYSMLNKFIVWPLLAYALILIDGQFLHMLTDDVILVIMLLAATPLAANMVVISSFFNLHPEKAAIAVALSTLFALIYLPIYIGLVHLI